MKKIYISYCTEYEAGWGQRPDGFILADDLAIIQNYVEEKNKDGKPDYFWRYSEPKEVWCIDDDYVGLLKRIQTGSYKGIAHFSDHEPKNFSLYSKIM